VADGIDPSMQTVQSSAPEPVIDGLTCDAERCELRAGDHAVLARRKQGDFTIDRASSKFSSSDGVNFGLGAHGAMVAQKP
jgi:hypothetical protein